MRVTSSEGLGGQPGMPWRTRLNDLSGRTVVTLTLPLAGHASLGVCDNQPPSCDGARNGEVPPLAARRQCADDADRSANSKANDEQDDTTHGRDLSAVSGVPACKALIATFVVPSQSCHQLLGAWACRIGRVRQKRLGVPALKFGGQLPMMEDLDAAPPATSIGEASANGFVV